ncbi:MAG: TetR family transcriptional regulator [Clostridia bacterium]|nr:TetR family transcriptional regulator [Clostridia bacterium]
MPVAKKSDHKNASRSRFYIKRAFGELLNEKDLGKITVTDIVERANISRGTFYAHYLDIFDLYNAIQSNVIEKIDTDIEEIGLEQLIADPTDAIAKGMLFLDANKSYYGLFVNSAHAEKLLSRILNYFEEKFEPSVYELFGNEDVEKVRAFLFYTLGAFQSVLVHWFRDQLPFTAQQAAHYLTEFYLNSRPPEILKLAQSLQQQKEQQ